MGLVFFDEAEMLKRPGESERGNAAIEFALLLPVYMILLLAAYFLGEAVLLRQKMRSMTRVLSENRGGWPLATYLRPVMLADAFYFDLDKYEARTLILEQEGGGMVDYLENPALRAYVSQAIQNGAGGSGVDADIANVLAGNKHFDWILGEERGGIISDSGSTLAAPAKMIFTEARGGEEFEQDYFGDYYNSIPEWVDVAPGSYYAHEGDPMYDLTEPSGGMYYGYFNVRANFSIVRGGGPSFPVPSDTDPYGNAIEPVVLEKFADNASPAGRMPPAMYRTLIPSDSVLGPRYFPFSWWTPPAPQPAPGGPGGGGGTLVP
jgi:hypothetical protein